jgi:hypothetical protein
MFFKVIGAQKHHWERGCQKGDFEFSIELQPNSMIRVSPGKINIFADFFDDWYR